MRLSFPTFLLVPRNLPFVPPSAAERRQLFSWARDAGFAGIELADGWLDFTRLDRIALGELRTEVADAGLEISGLNLPRCLVTRAPLAKTNYARVERSVQAAAILGAETVNFSLSLPASALSGPAPRPMRGDEASAGEHEYAARLVFELGTLAARAGVKLAVELHDDGLLDTPELCLQLLQRVNLPSVGVNPDVANLCRGPGPLPDWRRAYELLAPHAVNWHLKNYRDFRAAPLADGDIDCAVAWQIMRGAGYMGWVSNESRFGEVFAEQLSGVGYLQSLFAAAPQFSP